MTSKQIEARKEREARKYEVAKQIRELLDAARKQYGSEDWDAADIENEIIELVTGE